MATAALNSNTADGMDTIWAALVSAMPFVELSTGVKGDPVEEASVEPVEDSRTAECDGVTSIEVATAAEFDPGMRTEEGPVTGEGVFTIELDPSAADEGVDTDANADVDEAKTDDDEEGGMLMLMFVIVNWGDALPLSPNKIMI